MHSQIWKCACDSVCGEHVHFDAPNFTQQPQKSNLKVKSCHVTLFDLLMFAHDYLQWSANLSLSFILNTTSSSINSCPGLDAPVFCHNAIASCRVHSLSGNEWDINAFKAIGAQHKSMLKVVIFLAEMYDCHSLFFSFVNFNFNHSQVHIPSHWRLHGWWICVSAPMGATLLLSKEFHMVLLVPPLPIMSLHVYFSSHLSSACVTNFIVFLANNIKSKSPSFHIHDDLIVGCWLNDKNESGERRGKKFLDTSNKWSLVHKVNKALSTSKLPVHVHMVGHLVHQPQSVWPLHDQHTRNQ